MDDALSELRRPPALITRWPRSVLGQCGPARPPGPPLEGTLELFGLETPVVDGADDRALRLDEVCGIQQTVTARCESSYHCFGFAAGEDAFHDQRVGDD